MSGARRRGTRAAMLAELARRTCRRPRAARAPPRRPQPRQQTPLQQRSPCKAVQTTFVPLSTRTLHTEPSQMSAGFIQLGYSSKHLIVIVLDSYVVNKAKPDHTFQYNFVSINCPLYIPL